MTKNYNFFNFTLVVFTVPLNKQDVFKVILGFESRYLFCFFFRILYYWNITGISKITNIMGSKKN